MEEKENIVEKLKKFFVNNSKFKNDRKNVFLSTRKLINKKMYFKLYPHIIKKFNNSENKYLNIYKYMIQKSKIEYSKKIPSKKQIKKLLNNLKKYTYKIYIFKEQKEIERTDEYVEFQNNLLIKKILNLYPLKNLSELLEKIENYIDNYIDSLKETFSYRTLMNFRWKFNSLKGIIRKKRLSELLMALKNILLYRNIKYIYTTRNVIYIRRKRTWQLVYDSANFEYIIEKESPSN